MLNLVVAIKNINEIKAIKEAGANGVVVQCSTFSVPNDHCVEIKMLSTIKDECANCGIELYVKMNRLFFEEELFEVQEYLQRLKKLGVEGIYFSDEAVLYEARKLGIEHLLIYDANTLMVNSGDVAFYLKQRIKRVCLANELTLEEICDICERYKGQVEIMGHGRPMIMQTRRKLLSNYLDFFKLPGQLYQKEGLFIKEEQRNEHMPIYEGEYGTFVLSGKCLHSFQVFNELIKHHLGTMRIELDCPLEQLCKTILIYRQSEDSGIIYDPDAYEQLFPNSCLDNGFYFTKTSNKKERL